MIEIGIAADVVAGASALVLAVVAIKAFRSFESRKWWERKCQAYLKVLDALADAEAYYDRELRDAARLSEEPSSDIEGLADKSREAAREIQKTIDFAELFISDEARRRLIRYKNEMVAAGHPIDVDGNEIMDWVSHLIGSSEAIKSSKADMIKITKKDLKLP